MGYSAEVATGIVSRTANGNQRPARTPPREQLPLRLVLECDEAVPVDYKHTSLDFVV